MGKHTELSSLSVDALIEMREEISQILSRKADELKRQLSALHQTETNTSQPGRAGKGRKIAPQFRSKKNHALVWSGRGIIPRWMREEMKGTKLTKESFRIKS